MKHQEDKNRIFTGNPICVWRLKDRGTFICSRSKERSNEAAMLKDKRVTDVNISATTGTSISMTVEGFSTQCIRLDERTRLGSSNLMFFFYFCLVL